MTGIAKSKTFRNYLLRYFIIFMIPVCVSTFLILSGFLTRVRSESIERNRRYTQNAAEVLTERLGGLNNIAVKSCANINLTCYRIGINPARAVQEIKQYEQINIFCSKMYLYTLDRKNIYSSMVYNSDYNMIGRLYRDYAAVVQSFHVLEEPRLYAAESMFLYSQDTVRYVTYAVPIPWQSEHQDRVWVFLIDESTLAALMDNTIPVSGGITLVMQGDTVIYASDSGLYDMDGDTLAAVTGDADYTERNILGQNHMIFRSRVETNGTPFSVVIMAPTAVIMADYSALLTKFMATYLAITLVGLSLIFFFSYLNYNPIQSFVRTLAGSEAQPEPQDDVSFIQQSIDRMLVQNQQLARRIHSKDEMVKQQLILNYLHRQIQTIDELETQLAETGHPLEGKFYTVVCVYANSDARNISHVVIDAMESLSREGLQILGTHIVDMNLSIFLVGMEQDEKLSNVIHEGLRMLEENYSIQATAAMGHHYPRGGFIRKALSEAQVALQFMPVYGEGTVISYDGKINQMNYNSLYPKLAETRLMEAIRMKDIARVESAFDNLMEEIRREHIPVFYIKHIYFTLIDNIDQLDLGWKPDQFSQNLYEILNYSLFLNNCEILDKFAQMKDMVVATLRDSENDARLINLMITYIRANFHRVSFSIANVADNFNVSASYMRRYFKQMTGKTIQQYVDDIRFEKATGLLRQPQVPIKRIVMDIGYSDYSSFIRKFKGRYGYTPADYRKRYLLNQERKELG